MMAILSALALFLMPIAASAHELWFIDPHAGDLPARPELFSSPTALGVYLVAFTAMVFVSLVAARKWHVTSDAVKAFEKKLVFPFHARQILAALIGVDLVWNALGGTLFAPNLPLPAGLNGEVLKWIAVITGMLFIFFEYFWFECSIALLGLFVAVAVGGGPAAAGQQLLFAGSAIFLAATAPRSWFTKSVSLVARQRSYMIFKIFLGVNFLALVSVKWLHPELDLALIAQFPALNFLSSIGMDAATFVFCAALVETLGALAITFNLFVRPVAMILVPLFTLSAFVLGPKEIISHFPIQAALAVLILYGHTYSPKHKTHLAYHGGTSQAFETLPV